MLDSMEKMIKERLLQDLIDRMSDAGGDRLKPHGIGVEVQAKDPSALEEGLDKAKDLVGENDLSPKEDAGDDDEDRLLQMLEEDEEKEK